MCVSVLTYELFFQRLPFFFNKVSHGLPVCGLPVDTGCDKTHRSRHGPSFQRSKTRIPEAQIRGLTRSGIRDDGLWRERRLCRTAPHG